MQWEWMQWGGGGGMLATWDPLLYSLKAYKFFGGIFLYGNIRGVSEPIFFINLYAPCKKWVAFWERLDQYRLLVIDNLMIMGDFNATLYVEE